VKEVVVIVIMVKAVMAMDNASKVRKIHAHFVCTELSGCAVSVVWSLSISLHIIFFIEEVLLTL